MGESYYSIISVSSNGEEELGWNRSQGKTQSTTAWPAPSRPRVPPTPVMRALPAPAPALLVLVPRAQMPMPGPLTMARAFSVRGRAGGDARGGEGAGGAAGGVRRGWRLGQAPAGPGAGRRAGVGGRAGLAVR